MHYLTDAVAKIAAASIKVVQDEKGEIRSEKGEIKEVLRTAVPQTRVPVEMRRTRGEGKERLDSELER
jgi:hypothetical protein